MPNKKLNKKSNTESISMVDSKSTSTSLKQASDGVDSPQQNSDSPAAKRVNSDSVKEINGPRGLEPTRYGDWESKGRCYDF